VGGKRFPGLGSGIETIVRHMNASCFLQLLVRCQETNLVATRSRSRPFDRSIWEQDLEKYGPGDMWGRGASEAETQLLTTAFDAS